MGLAGALDGDLRIGDENGEGDEEEIVHFYACNGDTERAPRDERQVRLRLRARRQGRLVMYLP